MKKFDADIILHMCTENDNQKVRSEVRQIFLVHFLPF